VSPPAVAVNPTGAQTETVAGFRLAERVEGLAEEMAQDLRFERALAQFLDPKAGWYCSLLDQLPRVEKLDEPGRPDFLRIRIEPPT